MWAREGTSLKLTTSFLFFPPNFGSASSILQKNTKLYGPMNSLDIVNECSSWNSEGNQRETSLAMNFGRLVAPMVFKWQFQAGFAARSCSVFDDQKNRMAEFELDDVHELQVCRLHNNTDNTDSASPTKSIKFLFDDLCDFYGRVILYKIEVWGIEMEP
jgi:hypothetical protein